MIISKGTMYHSAKVLQVNYKDKDICDLSRYKGPYWNFLIE